MPKLKAPLLILLRHCPGAGASTFASYLEAELHQDCDAIMVEADQYMVNTDGNFDWRPELLGRNHAMCWEQTEVFLKAKRTVIVSNTFSTEKELQPYYEMAERLGVQVVSLIVENRHNGVNQHGVPEEKLLKIRDRFSIQLLSSLIGA